MKKPARQKKTKYERSADQPIAITPVEYSGLQEAYDHFNAGLFDGALPDVFITLQRRANSKGYFSPDRFSARSGKFERHELALNPDCFTGRTDEEICSTLVHEQAHVWQEQNGTAPARGYHDKEFATKMKAVGLQPSSTGAVGGKETGQHMTHYIIPDGVFTKAFAKLAATGWKLNLQSAHRLGPNGGTNSKTKFTCTSCGQNAWGKPDLEINCRPCGIQMRAAVDCRGIKGAVPGRGTAQCDAPAGEATVPLPSYEINPPGPVKRKPGRPKGSQNKPKATVTAIESYVQQPTEPRRRGRPKGSKNKKMAA